MTKVLQVLQSCAPKESPALLSTYLWILAISPLTPSQPPTKPSCTLWHHLWLLSAACADICLVWWFPMSCPAMSTVLFTQPIFWSGQSRGSASAHNPRRAEGRFCPRGGTSLPAGAGQWSLEGEGEKRPHFPEKHSCSKKWVTPALHFPKLPTAVCTSGAMLGCDTKPHTQGSPFSSWSRRCYC